MKGIELCAECAYYNMKSHKCTRSCKIEPDIKKGENIHFFVDCPLPDVQPVKHGRWIDIYEYCKAHDLRPSGLEVYYWCSKCDKAEKKTSDFCPNCGARMDGENKRTNTKDEAWECQGNIGG